MNKSINSDEWLKRALSNLNLGKNLIKGVNLEDFCFNFQQAVEKSLKAVLVKNDIKTPKTHSIAELLSIIQELSITIPEAILKNAPGLSIYAVDTRYPDNYFVVDKDDYTEAMMIAEEVYEWVEKLINK